MKKLFIIGVLLLLFPLRGFTASLTHGPVVGGIASDSAILFTRSSVSAVVDFEYSINSDLSSSTISSPVTTISGNPWPEIYMFGYGNAKELIINHVKDFLKKT